MSSANTRDRGFTLSDKALELISRKFAALAEPMRLKLVHTLFAGEMTVSALVSATGGTQTNVSRHLGTLTQAGILSRRKSGLNVLYTISDPTIHRLCELVCGSLEKQLSEEAGALAPASRR